MGEPKITIIIPVYNTEKYLRKCLDSILTQHEQSFEVILVDDGSTDGSGIICDEFAQSDSRFLVVHKQNGGVSSARNVGLEMAVGKWVAFIDSDDEISPDFLTIPIQYEDADIIQKADIWVYSNGVKIKKTVINDHYLTSHREVGNYWINRTNNYLAVRLIARECIGDTRFLIGVKISEDFLFFTSILHNVNRYAFSSVGHYYYYQRENSAMYKFKDDIREDIRITFEHLNIVRTYECHSNMVEICENLVFGYFMKTLWRRRRYLTPEERKCFKTILSEMRLGSLSLCKPKIKLGMMIVKIIGQYIM